MARKPLTFALLALLAITAHAQHFDWVKSYSGRDSYPNHNYVTGVVADSHGNLYVTGVVENDDEIDGVHLLPMTPHGAGPVTQNAFVMKFSPEGQLLWRKALHANNYSPSTTYGLELLSDTSLMINAMFEVHSGERTVLNEYTYYLDTLLYSEQAAAVLPWVDSVMSPLTMAFITLDCRDGHLLDHHFLSYTVTDTTGQMVMGDRQMGADFADRYANNEIRPGPFHVDREGNIYLVSMAQDNVYIYDSLSNWRLAVSDGTVQDVIVLVDGHPSLTLHPQPLCPSNNLRILKFSPNFDSLTYRYVFTADIPRDAFSDAGFDMAVDEDQNVYLIVALQRTSFQPIDQPLDGSDLTYHFGEESGALIKFNRQLEPQYIKQLTFTRSDTIAYGWGSRFNGLYIDEETGTVTVVGRVITNTLDVHNGPAYPDRRVFIDSTEIEVLFQEVVFIQFDKETGRYLSHGNAKSEQITTYYSRFGNEFVVNNGRVMTQIGYRGNVICGDDTTSVGRLELGMGLYIWDTAGHPLQFVDYGVATSSGNLRQSSIVLRDSILYLTGGIAGGATFGDITVNGEFKAYIARYVDTAFMSPYVHVDYPGNVNITLVEGGNAFVAYPNPFRQSVKIRVESGELKVESGVVTAWLTDIMGRREQVRLTPDCEGMSSGHSDSGAENIRQYSLDLTSRPQATYLLTLTTADGKTHTVRLMKMSDIFTR